MEHAVWYKNKSLTRALKNEMTPWEALYGYKPVLTRDTSLAAGCLLHYRLRKVVPYYPRYTEKEVGWDTMWDVNPSPSTKSCLKKNTESLGLESLEYKTETDWTTNMTNLA